MIMIKRLSLIIGILFILVISAGFSSAITGAMGNARMVLYPEVNGWTNTIIEKSILVKNVNDESINITLQLTEEAEKFIELIDKSFILQPNTEEQANFLVKVRKEGTYTGKINVFFSSLEENKAGVALSSEIIVIAKKNQGYEEEEEESTEEEDSEETEDVTDEEDKSPFSGIWVFFLSTFVLLIILVGLIILLSKKGEKRRKKVNARKKS